MVILGLKFFMLNLIFLLFAATLDRSGLIKRIMDLGVKKGGRVGFHILLSTIFILSPLYLFPVFLYRLPNVSKRINKEKTGLTLLMAAVMLGSILLPFGNQRNLFFSTYFITTREGFSPLRELVPHIWPYWFLLLAFLNLVAYLLRVEVQDNLVKLEKVRYQELILSGIALFFIFPFAMGKLNFLGFIFLTGFLFFAFISKETIKRVRWWFLLPPAIAIPLSMMPLKIPVPLKGLPMLFVPFISSGFITSDLSAIVFSSIRINMPTIIMGVAGGSLLGLWGGFELIYIYFIRKERFKPVLLSLIGVFVFLLGLLTLKL
ncbi:hypothetical protein DRQ17_00330 [bacterium]|nr:MAG: hypothetical protein DRQ17_00330 [bacterium]